MLEQLSRTRFNIKLELNKKLNQEVLKLTCYYEFNKNTK
jgi:hypothetical protein